MPRQWSKCYLCGGDGARTSDHVFAGSLFPDPRPVNLITAPAHRKCNGKYGPDENDFRVFVLSGLPNDAARALWDGPVRRSFRRDPASGIRLLRQVSKMDVRSPGGLYLGTVDTISPEPRRIERVLEKHARGLLYEHYREILPHDAEFSHHQLVGNPNPAPIPPEVMELARGLNPAVMLGESVTYRYGKPSDEASVSVWLLQYFRRQSFLVMAGPAGFLEGGSPRRQET